jgi:uncharacterized membrane protein YphA (DoxX/SURF4 family)
MSFDNRNWPEILARAARYGLAAVFLTSALAKLLSPSQFHIFVSSMGIPALINSSFVLHAVVVGELVLAALVLYPLTSKSGRQCLLAFLFSFPLCFCSDLLTTRMLAVDALVILFLIARLKCQYCETYFYCSCVPLWRRVSVHRCEGSNMSRSLFRKDNWLQVAGVFIIVLLMLIVVLLIRQNRELKSGLTALKTGQRPSTLWAGRRVGPVNLHTLAGTGKALDYGDTPTDFLLL